MTYTIISIGGRFEASFLVIRAIYKESISGTTPCVDSYWRGRRGTEIASDWSGTDNACRHPSHDPIVSAQN